MTSTTVTVVPRGGVGGGGENTFTGSYLTGPPDSTITKDRGVHPNIKGSTGGFIGLISGIAVVLILGVFLGFYLYNRRRRKRLLQNRAHNPPKSLNLPGRRSSRFGIPGFSAPHDPYADPIPSPHLSGRPAYGRERSEEWEIPSPQSLHAPLSRDPSPGRGTGGGGALGLYGRGRTPDPPTIGIGGTGVAVELPDEPDEAAAPLRSRSPRLSPRMFEDEEGDGVGAATSQSERDRDRKGKGKGKQREVQNPFESLYDNDRLSPRIGERDLD